MAIFDDPLLREEDPLEPGSGSRDFGLKLFKSAEEAYRNDVVARAPTQPQSPDQAAYQALYGAGSASGSSAPAPLNDQAAYQMLFGGGVAPSKPAEEQGNFSRGMSVSGKQLKQTAYGTAALIGDTTGIDSLKDWGLKGYQAAEKEVQAISKESDSFTKALETGEVGKWLTYSAGYLLGQVGEMGAASLAGAALGSLAAPGGGTVAGAVAGAVEKGAVEAGIKGFVGKMIDKQVAANVARGMAEDAALKKAVTTVYGTIGATTANTFLNATQELGSIYGDAVEEAALTGKEYSLGKVWLSGIAATAVDSWADSKAVGKLMDAVKGGKGIGGVAMEAFKGGFREGMTEGVQTFIERWGADKDVSSQEAMREYIDSAAVGVLGGSVSGGGAAAVKKAFEPTEKKKDEFKPETEDDSAVDKAQVKLDSPISIQQKELVAVLRDPDAMAYLYAKADDAGKANIEAALTRAGAIDAFNAVKGQADAINNGQEKLAEFPEYETALSGAIAGYAHGAQAVTPKGKELQAPPSQFDAQSGDADNTQPRDLIEYAKSEGNRIGGVSHLRGIVESLIKTYVDQGRDAGRAKLEDMAANVRGDTGFAEEIMIPGFLDELDQQIASSAQAFTQRQGRQATANTQQTQPRGSTTQEPWKKTRAQIQADRVNPLDPKLPLKEQLAERFMAQDSLNDGWTREPGENKYGIISAVEPESQSADVSIRRYTHKALGGLWFNSENDVFDALKLRKGYNAAKQAQPAGDDGIRFNKTEKPTVADLPNAIRGVMESMTENGPISFQDAAVQVVQRIRASERWSSLSGNVTPAVLRAAYKSLPQDRRQSDAEVDAVTAQQLRDAVNRSAPQKAQESAPKSLPKTEGFQAKFDSEGRVTNATGRSEIADEVEPVEASQAKQEKPKTGRMQTVTAEIQGRIDKLESNKDRDQAQKLLDAGKYDEAEAVVDAVFERNNQADKSLLGGARRKVELLKRVFSSTGIPERSGVDATDGKRKTVTQKLDELLADGATPNNVQTAEQIIARESTHIMRGLLKAASESNDQKRKERNTKLADRVFEVFDLGYGAVRGEMLRLRGSIEAYEDSETTMRRVFDPNRKPISKTKLEPFKHLQRWIAQTEEQVGGKGSAYAIRLDLNEMDGPELAALNAGWGKIFEREDSMAKMPKYQASLNFGGEEFNDRQKRLDNRLAAMVSRLSGYNALRDGLQHLRDQIKAIDEQIAAMDNLVIESEGGRREYFRAQNQRDHLRHLFGFNDESNYARNEGGFISDRGNSDRDELVLQRQLLTRELEEATKDSVKGRANVLVKAADAIRDKILEAAEAAVIGGTPFEQVSQVTDKYREIVRVLVGGKEAGSILKSIKNEIDQAVEQGVPRPQATQTITQKYIDSGVLNDDGSVRTTEDAKRLKQEVEEAAQNSAESLTKDMFEGLAIAEKVASGEMKPADAAKLAVEVGENQAVVDAMHVLARKIKEIGNDNPIKKAEQDAAIKRAFLWIVNNMKAKTLTFQQAVDAFRGAGLDVPQDIIRSSIPALHIKMLDYTKQMGGGYAPREYWLRSMNQALEFWPELKDTFSDAELGMYEEWKARQEGLLNRRKMSDEKMESFDIETAFDGLLFMKYGLAEMRNPRLIANERDRLALTNTIGDLVGAWHRDLVHAKKVRPDLYSQLAGDEDSRLLPTDVASHEKWLESQREAENRKAEMIEKSKYILALPNIPGLSDVEMSEVRKALIASELSRADQILDNANQMSDIKRFGGRVDPETGEIITDEDAARASIVDELLANDPAQLDLEVNGTLGRIDTAYLNQDAQAEIDSGIDEVTDEDGNEIIGGREAVAEDESLLSEEELRRLDDGVRERKGFFSGLLTKAVVESWVSEIRSKEGIKSNVVVLESPAQLPDGIRERVMERLAGSDAAGLFDSETGQVYLFSSNLSSKADVEFTLFHEVYGHLGMRAFLGAKFDAFLERMYSLYPEVKRLADARMERGMGKLEAIDEVLSDMAGDKPEASAVKSYIGRIVVGLREIGLGRVADWIAKISNVELSYYMKGARDAARNGGYVASGAPGVVRLAEAQQHERLSEMFALRGDKTNAYARFNPVTQEWFVYLSTGDDISKSHTAFVSGDYNDVLKIMRSRGHVEFRKRSGVFVEDRLNGGLVRMPKTQDITGVKAWMRSMITKFQNEYRPVFDLVNAMKAAGRVTERMDIIDALRRYESKTAFILEDFRNRFARPLESLVQEAGKQGANQKIIDRYLLARTAEERNKQIAKINEKYPDGGSGMKTKAAARYLKQLQAKPYWDTLEEIGRITDQISQKKLKYQLDTGMITVAQYEKFQVYKHYVNLSGRSDLNLDQFDDPMVLAGGSKFNLKGSEKRAMGRASEPTDILARTLLGMEAALIRGQKNQVAQRVLAFFEANYDPNFVTINKIAYKQVIGDDGMVTEKEDENYYGQKNVMVAKINGIPNTIEFKDTSPESFAEAIHGVVGYRDQNAVLERMGKFNRIVGQMLTTYNPVWGAVNFIRDVQTMFFNAAADGRLTKAQAAAMVKAIPSAMKTAFYMAKTQNRKNTNINPDPEMVRVFREMQLNGGMTYFMNRKDLTTQVEELDKLLGERGRFQNAKDKVHGIADWIEHNMSLPIEIAPRLAAYKVMRENGFSPAEAAQFAGEITVNFNMRGSSQAMRQLYLFFNPAMQGSAKLLSLFATLDHDYKLKFKTKGFAYAAAWIGVGALINLVGRAMGDDDEAGRNSLDKIPVWKRATSMVISPDTPFGSIPIPYGWNAFYAMGHFMMDSLLGIQPITVTVGRIAKTTVESFAPLGTAGFDSNSLAGTVLKGVAPTAALPIVEWVMNENRYGAPIRREADAFGGAQMPDSQMAFRSVNPLSKAAMQGINEITGGNKYRSGAVDINPAAVDFIISSYMPGFINETYKGVGLAIRKANGEEIKNTPIPLVDRFTAKVPESYDAGSFRRAKEMIETKYNEYKNMPELRDQIREEYPGLMRAHAVVTSINQEIRKVNATLLKVENNSGFSDEEKVRRLNETRERQKMLQERAVKAVMDAGPKFREAVMASD